VTFLAFANFPASAAIIWKPVSAFNIPNWKIKFSNSAGVRLIFRMANSQANSARGLMPRSSGDALDDNAQVARRGVAVGLSILWRDFSPGNSTVAASDSDSAGFCAESVL